MTLTLWPCPCGQWHPEGHDPCDVARVVDLVSDLGLAPMTAWQLALVRSVFGTAPADRHQISGRSLPREGGGGSSEPSPAEPIRARPIVPERCPACGSWRYGRALCAVCEASS